MSGVLLLDKPAGISSNGLLQRVRRLFRAAKAGHTGTLDPFATGLLPIAMGEATKFSSGLLEADKAYRASIRLGIRTSTGDPEGAVLEQRPVDCSAEQVQSVVERFHGAIDQVPPMYSALKREGRPLYDYARAGITVPRDARRVNIHAIVVLSFATDILELDVRCSKGTYIRTLAEDIGAALGCGAHLQALRRTAIGRFRVAGAHNLESLEPLSEAERDALLLPIDALVADLPEIALDAAPAAQLANGQRVSVPAAILPVDAVVRVYGAARDFLGLASVTASGELQPRRLISGAHASPAPGGLE